MADPPDTNSIVELVVNSPALDAAADLGEISLDSFLDDEFLSDIPVLGSVLKLYRAGVGVSGYLFARKLLKFLRATHEIPEEKRRAFASRMDEDPKRKKKVGDHLLLLLDRLDDLDKPELVARAFQALLRNRIDFEAFVALGAAIDRCLVRDLPALDVEGETVRLHGDTAVRLQSCGLVAVRSVPAVPHPDAPVEYQTTQLGNLLREIVLGRTSP